MGAPCSCSKMRSAHPLLSDSIKYKSYASTFEPGSDATQLRKDLLGYIQANEKDMNNKLLVMFQKAVNFPDECLGEIALARCAMREGDWPHFMRFIYAGRNAKSFDIRAVSLSLTGYNVICRSLEVLKQLRFLSLCDLGLGFYVFSDFVASLQGFLKLSHLDLSGNVLGSGHFEDLLPVIISLPVLTECFLDRNEIDDKGAALLAQQVTELDHLTVLSLRVNLLTQAGIAALRESANKQTKLQLSLDQTKPSTDATKEISQSVL